MKAHLDRLPILVLEPHNRCNCRCVMCDIWRANAHGRELSEADLAPHIEDLRSLGVRWITLSGGEALMHRNLFGLCEQLEPLAVRISLLSTGLLLRRHAAQIVTHTNDVIVSLDGSPAVHDAIRNVPRAFERLADGIALVGRLRATVQIPLLFMTYYNLVFQYGDERLARDAAAAGLDGLIVPDLPPEEAGALESAARAAGLHLIYLIAPTTPLARIKFIAERGGGFLYYVSLTGITGAKLPALDQVEQGVARIRRVTDLPVAVGFGVSTPEEAGRIAGVADGVIVASALIKRLQAQPDARRRREELTTYLASLKAALAPHQVSVAGGSE